MLSNRHFRLALLTVVMMAALWIFRSNGPSVSLEHMVGQMFIVGFKGTAVTLEDPICQDIRQYNLGGVILFDKDVEWTYDEAGQPIVRTLPERNITSPEQLKALTQDLQAAVSRKQLPIFVAVDQEGGRVARLSSRHGFKDIPSAHAVGSKDDVQYTYEQALLLATELQAAGINLNFAPVVDVGVQPENFIARSQRIFSVDPMRVAAHAAAFVQAHRAHKVIATLKHFPGHGSSLQNSHEGFTDITQTWTEQELIAYRELIHKGYADVIMTSHTFNEQLDSERVATLSAKTLALLRNDLGYAGVIISDDLEMDALAKHYSMETILQDGILAGIDIFLINNKLSYDPHIVRRYIETVVRLVQTGRIPKSRIAESYARIAKLKRQYL